MELPGEPLDGQIGRLPAPRIDLCSELRGLDAGGDGQSGPGDERARRAALQQRLEPGSQQPPGIAGQLCGPVYGRKASW